LQKFCFFDFFAATGVFFKAGNAAIGSESRAEAFFHKPAKCRRGALLWGRISTALNFLRRRTMIEYTNHGRLVLNVNTLESYPTSWLSKADCSR
jgi:hypothetical protein